MTEQQFGSGDSDPVEPQEGSFSRDGDQTSGQQADPTMTSEELARLLKRDENAQEHIPRLETENEDLRTRVAELQAQVESATDLEDVVARLQNDQSGNVMDADKIVDTLEQRLEAKSRAKVEEDNWESVANQLEAQYGEWKQVDAAITAKCKDLSMDPLEATRLARQNPTAFLTLFGLSQGTPAQVSPASQSNIQTSAALPNAGAVLVEGKTKAEWKEYYNQMRREKYGEWQKLKTQKEMWARVYGD